MGSRESFSFVLLLVILLWRSISRWKIIPDKMFGVVPSTFNFSKVKSYTYENLEGLSDYFDQCERQFPAQCFEDKVKILVLASPTRFQSRAENAVEQYCDEWGGDKHKEFREYYGKDADVYDVGQGERVYRTPYKKKATRLLDGEDEPSYEVARSRILAGVLGREGIAILENKLEKPQGTASVRDYVAEFQSVVKTLIQLQDGAVDERRYGQYFVSGLQPNIQQLLQIPDRRGESNLNTLYEAAESAADKAILFGKRISVWGTQGQDKFQVHPSRRQLMVSPAKAEAILPLFSEEEHLATNASDPIVGAFVYGLNAVTQSGEYLRMVADAGGLRLDETASLLSSKTDIAVLHSALRGALRNISSAAQLERVLQACFPRQFRADKIVKLPQPASNATVPRANETLNAVQSELLNFKNEIFERLKEAQKTNAREQNSISEQHVRAQEQNMRAQNNILERINAAEHFDRNDQRRGSKVRGENNGFEEPKGFQDRVLERLNALQQTQDANKRKWDTAFEDRNKRSKEEERNVRLDRGDKRDSSGGKSLKCFECNQEGHRKSECPKLRGSGRGDDECRFCKKPGHTVEDCEMRKDHVCKECGKKGHSKMWCTPKECNKCNTKHSPLNGCPRRG